MRVIVCGDRHWGVIEDTASDADTIRAMSQRRMVIARIEELSRSTAHVQVIVGGAKGADLCAEAAARALHLDVRVVKAQWHKHGKSAGPRRNQKMLDLNPDLVIAFHQDLRTSKGTRDMVLRAEKAGVPTEVIGA